jgi:nucleotide-binding universal stress UspA family protein
MSTAVLPVHTGPDPIVVPGTDSPAGDGPVLVALDDDDNAGALLRRGCGLAARLGVVVRVAYVWSDCRPPDCAHHRCCHRDLAEAGRLLSGLLDEHLTVEESRRVERDVLHSADPAETLIALSAFASMLVVGSSSDRPGTAAALGATTRAILGRTRCPVMVVPYRRLSATRVSW